MIGGGQNDNIKKLAQFCPKPKEAHLPRFALAGLICVAGGLCDLDLPH
jgi:hypothetical protein